jgi:putative MATE family efflux protein
MSSAPRPAAPPAPSVAPKFTHGSIMRHVVVMTATGSIGLMAIFIVDFLNLFYIALLGQQELAAAIGYAGTVLFFTVSLSIGVTIAGSALVSRALGARKRDEARRLATSSLVFMAVLTTLLSLVTLPLLGPILTLFGATGRTADIAWRFLIIVFPTTPILGLGMACSGILRAAGDAKRAMYVTLAGGIVTAALDPLLIFGFGWGVDGAAIASIFSRLALAVVGFHGCIRVHDLLARLSLRAALADTRPLAGIAVPAILANVATPVGNAIVTAAIARYGDSAVAGYAVIGRIIPLAFGAIFALSGSVGPIIGQNFGARRFDRVRRTILDSLIFMLAYCLIMWLALALLCDPIIRLFAASGSGAELIRFFAYLVAGSWVFVGMLFVANAAFNNLGYPTWSTFFNWGRATLGTIPFVWLGATQFGASGVLAGQAAGAVLFGIGAIAVSLVIVNRLAQRQTSETADSIPATAPAIPPFASGKVATAVDLGDAAPVGDDSRNRGA